MVDITSMINNNIVYILIFFLVFIINDKKKFQKACKTTHYTNSKFY